MTNRRTTSSGQGASPALRGRLVALACLSTLTVAPPPADAGEGHSHPHGHDHRFELALAAGLVYVPREQDLAASGHVHVAVAIPGTIAALGLGYERLFDEHAHNTIAVVLHCRVTERFNLTIAPGLTFEDDAPGDLAFSIHIEPSYEILVWEHLHLGPSLGVAAEAGGLHVSAGVHAGVGF